MAFEKFPPLFQVKNRTLSPEAQTFKEFESNEYTAENVERYNRGRVDFIKSLHNNIPVMELFPNLERLPFHYANGEYAGDGIVYRPRTDKKLPAAVYIHGGGWTTLNKECYEYECAAFAEKGNAVVFNVDYRMAPGYRFPVPQEDCYSALLAAAKQADSFNADPSRIAVIGDSAGGHLAAAVCIMARERSGPTIGHAVLCYPGIGFDDSPPKNEFDQRTAEIISLCTDEGYNLKYPICSPILDTKMAKMPKILMLVGTCDFLLDDNLRYARRLMENGADIELQLYEGMPHGFIQMTIPPAAAALEEISRILREL
jgi:acetyl esterase